MKPPKIRSVTVRNTATGEVILKIGHEKNTYYVDHGIAGQQITVEIRDEKNHLIVIRCGEK